MDAWLNVFLAKSRNAAGVYLTFAKAYERGPDIYERLHADREAIERETGLKLLWKRDGNKMSIRSPEIAFKNLDDAGERDRVTGTLADMTERMVRVLTPRLEAENRGFE